MPLGIHRSNVRSSGARLRSGKTVPARTVGLGERMPTATLADPMPHRAETYLQRQSQHRATLGVRNSAAAVAGENGGEDWGNRPFIDPRGVRENGRGAEFRTRREPSRQRVNPPVGPYDDEELSPRTGAPKGRDMTSNTAMADETTDVNRHSARHRCLGDRAPYLRVTTKVPGAGLSC